MNFWKAKRVNYKWLSNMVEGKVTLMKKSLPQEITKNNITYRLVKVRDREKYVSENGDLINPYRNQECKISINADGYPCSGGSIPVHLYVAHGWVDGYFEGAEVNHKDFDRNNYKASNLEWVSHKQNIEYTLSNNYNTVCLSKQGTKNGRAKFTEDEVRIIRKMYDEGSSIADIIRYFYPELKAASQYRNIHSNITLIAKRKTWKCLPE